MISWVVLLLFKISVAYKEFNQAFKAAHYSSTLNDGQQNDDNKEEEGDVKQNTVELGRVTGRVLDFITDATASSHTHVHVEQVALRSHGICKVNQSSLDITYTTLYKGLRFVE